MASMQWQILWTADTASIQSITTNGSSRKMDRWEVQPTLPVSLGEDVLHINHEILTRRIKSSHRSGLPDSQYQKLLGNRNRHLLDFLGPGF